MAADAAERAPAVYLSRQLDDASPGWQFYVTKQHRQELLQRTRYFDGDGLDPVGAAPSSLAVFYENQGTFTAVPGSAAWSVERTVLEPSGGARSVVLRKTPR